ncbi:MAG: F0F1 ATP synthase subunit A [Chloroflexota bacterium]|nr:F0F1 ATP synthase subunit A [Chloroflexota bacterium]
MEDKFTVSMKAEQVFAVGGFSITNSMVTTVVVIILLSIMLLAAFSKAKLVPGRWQALWELIIEFLLNLVEGSLKKKAGRVFFPLLATFFVYILIANWFSLLPGVGTIGIYEKDIEVPIDNKPIPIAEAQFAIIENRVEIKDKSGKPLGEDEFFEAGTAVKILTTGGNLAHVQEVVAKGEGEAKPIEGEGVYEGYVALDQLVGAKEYRTLVPYLRAPNADLNMTLAMALITIILVQIVAVRSHGLLGYLKEFFPKPYWLDPLLTPIEIVSQISRLISLTVRLFGNVFAGEALLAIIIKIASPILFVFIGLELFFGLIQALVFFSLTTVYMTLAVFGMEGGHEEEHGSHSHGSEENTAHAH